MVEKLYLKDQYLKESDAKVVAVIGNGVELDKTIFYPSGGGEPCDTGSISISNKSYRVTETKSSDGSITHIFDSEPAAKAGDSAHCALDWSKRYAYMRYHTAVHVIGGVIEKRYGGMYTGGQIYEDRARDDFDLPSLNRELALNIIKEAQSVIDSNRKVSARMLPRAEALKIPNLARTAPGAELLNSLEEVRVVEIENFDVQMDGGLHVANTSEIGRIELTNFENKGVHRKRIEIVLK